MKFLVIEDAQEIVDAVSLCLSLRWPDAEVLSADEGRRGLEIAAEQAPDLVILDIGLPDISGLEVLRALRRVSDVPIVMLTVQDEDEAVARYLDEGADEYVVKPFGHLELIGRLQALMRRTQGRGRPPSRTLQAGDLSMNFGADEVYRAGEPLSLSRTELALLEELVRSATKVVTYEAMVAKVKSISGADDVDVRLVRIHVQNLRSKLEDEGETPRYIANVFGLGYKFVSEVSSSVPGMLGQDGNGGAAAPVEDPIPAPQVWDPVGR